MKLTYILPSDLSHIGIKKKVKGQLHAFSKKYVTQLIYLKSPLHYINFHFNTLVALIRSDIIYVRYNPKVPLVNILCVLFSIRKTVFFEHNVKYDIELAYLKKSFERRIHLINEKIIILSKIYHVCVTTEILNYLVSKGFSSLQMLYVQNGYQIEKVIPENVDMSVVNAVSQLKKNGKKIMVFIGSHYPWHGLNNIIDEIKELDSAQLIIIGPKDKVPSQLPLNCHVIGSCNYHTLVSILEHCDYGFGPYCWDLIGITEGSPLKSREYLSYGLPIIVNYRDCAVDFGDLQPYIFDKRHNVNAVKEALSSHCDKSTLRQIARARLAWDQVLKPVFERIGS